MRHLMRHSLINPLLICLLPSLTNTSWPLPARVPAALRMDFNRHVLESVVLTNNDGDGLGIMYSDTFKVDSVNHLRRVQARGNRGHGVSVRTLWLDLTGGWGGQTRDQRSGDMALLASSEITTSLFSVCILLGIVLTYCVLLTIFVINFTAVVWYLT